ncbi:MAG: hypothetical protein WKG32_07175 [Gemmatimonadaceae bacterium]
MEAGTIAALAPPRVTAAERTAAAPWHLYAALFGSTSIVIGLIWDISWHTTIGRDSLWTPAHVAMYLGGVVAGLACGARVLLTTFAGSATERAASVRFWHFFYGPLGAWLCIWGTFAMLTSAPFDDWWHNAYGLDVKILSPPHSVLALGMIGVSFGALLIAVALQNRSRDESESRFRLMYAYAGGVLVVYAAIMASEYLDRGLMHSSIFYKVACVVFPLFLAGIARASRMRWPATSIAAVYTVITIAMGWILPLFPAEPRLGPIYQHVTRMVPMDFPLLLVIPAIGIDWVARRLSGRRNDWLLAAALGVTFLVLFAAVQWPFAHFLQSEASQNWFFYTDNYFYGLSDRSSTVRRVFFDVDASASARLLGLTVIAPIIAMVSARAGLWWGAWLRGVRR